MNTEYVCKDCKCNLAMCFKCKKKGSFYPELSSSKSKSRSRGGLGSRSRKPAPDPSVNETGDEDGSDKEGSVDADPDSTPTQNTKSKPAEEVKKFNELIKCSTANCNKFFHYECIKDNPLFKFFDANKHKKFRCSLHYCAKCKISGDTMAIAQCLRCPRAYHLKCYPRDKVTKINKKSLICQVTKN